MMIDAIAAFKDAIRAAGLQPPDSIIDDAKIHRFNSGDNGKAQNGWYVLYPDDPASGAFGCWKRGIQQDWCSKSGGESSLTEAERTAIKARQKQAQAAREADRAEQAREAASKAAFIWSKCKPAPDDHPYLLRKGVKPHGIRATTPSAKYPDSSLVIPIYQLGAGTQKLMSLQFVRGDGSKLFLPGGELTGGCFTIASDNAQEITKIIVCEGFATGATIYEATGHDVAVAFNAGNLKTAAMRLHELFPDVPIILAVDDDYKTEGNPGITKAVEAALAVGGLVAVPGFGNMARGDRDTDFNDLAALCRAEGAPGAEMIRRCIEAAMTPEAAKNALSRIDGLTIQELVNRALTDIKTLFKPNVLKALSVWKKSQAGLYSEFKQALKAAGLSVVRDIESAMRNDGKGQEAKKTEGRDSSKNEGRARPRVEVGVDIAEMVDALENALIGAAVQLFVRAGTLCRLTHGSKNQDLVKREASAPVVALAPTAHLMELASSCISWFETKTKAGEIIVEDCLPPRIAVDALAARGSWNFPELRGVISAPTIREDGSLLSEEGYDKASGLFFEPGLTVFPEIPAKPTLQDARAAVAELLEVFADFPFLEPSDRSAAVAFLLTLISRYAIDGCTPMFLVRASTAGSGKSLLVDAVSIIATGRRAPRFAQEDSDEEARKRLFAIALCGDPLVLIDNIDKPLGSAALDAAITSGVIRDRILGKSETASAPWNAVLAGTGNNLQVKGDLARRCIPIDLDAGMEKPEEREGFKHSDLLAWAKAERGRLVAAGLTILRAFVVAGKPRQSIAQYGSFEQWSGLIRESIVWSGLPDPAAGRSRIRDTSDPALDDLREALVSWRDAFGSKALSLAEAIRDIEKSLAPNLGDHAQADLFARLKEALGAFDHRFDGKRLNPKAVGRALLKHKDRIVDGLSFRQMGRGHKSATLWKVEHAVDDYGGFGGFGGSGSIPREEKPYNKKPNTEHDDSSIYGFHTPGGKTNPPNPPNPPNPQTEPDTDEEWGDA